MSDFMAVILIGYVQYGLLLAWYLFHRRVAAVRDEFRSGGAERDASLHELETEVAEIRRRMRDLTGHRSRRPFHGESQALKQTKCRGALEMARRGMDVYHIAATLNMRRAEVEMLVHLERLRRDARPPGQNDDRPWLETAS